MHKKMETDNTLLSHELEEMRSQIGILKEKLEKQAIVNDLHIRNSMKSKMSDINRVVIGAIAGGVFALVYCTWFFLSQGLSLAFVIATAVMLAVCLGLTIYQKSVLGKVDFSQGDLVATAQTLSKVRSHYQEWWKIAVPMIVVWFSWLMYEMISRFGTEPYVIGFCVGACVGGVIGGIIGMRMNRKVVRRAGEILDQIKDLDS